MSNVFRIETAPHAPWVCKASSTGADTDIWPDPSTFLVLPWGRPDESDGDFLGYAGATTQAGAQNIVDPNDDLTLTWRHLSTAERDHYTAYLFSGTTPAHLGYKLKMGTSEPRIHGNISPHAVSCTFLTELDDTTALRHVPIAAMSNRVSQTILSTTSGTRKIVLAGDYTSYIAVGDVIFISGTANAGSYVVQTISYSVPPGTEIVTVGAIAATLAAPSAGELHFGDPVMKIYGNRAINFGPGVQFDIINSYSSLNDDTNYVVVSAALGYDDDGEYTSVTFKCQQDVDIANSTTGQGQCVYSTNVIWLPYTYLYNADIDCSLVDKATITERVQREATYDGRYAQKAYTRQVMIERLDFEIAYGGITAEELYRLWKMAKYGLRCSVTDISDTGTVQFTNVLVGHLRLPNDTGSADKFSEDMLRFSFVVDEERDMDMGPGSTAGARNNALFLAIKTATANTSLTVDGDWTWLLNYGQHIAVDDSTGNDGFYHIDSTSYDASTDVTTIVTYPLPPNGTDDGRIEVIQLA